MSSGYALSPQIIKSDTVSREFARVSGVRRFKGVNTTTVGSVF
jgi:hypothetical protein